MMKRPAAAAGHHLGRYGAEAFFRELRRGRLVIFLSKKLQIAMAEANGRGRHIKSRFCKKSKGSCPGAPGFDFTLERWSGLSQNPGSCGAMAD